MDKEGLLAAPGRMIVGLQMYVSGVDASFVATRRYIENPGQREEIARALTQGNCIEFLERLGDASEAVMVPNPDDVKALSLDVARLVDSEQFVLKSRDSSLFFRSSIESIAVRTIKMFTSTMDESVVPLVANSIVRDELALSVAMELFVDSYFVTRRPHELLCELEEQEALAFALASNVLKAANEDRLLKTCNPVYILGSLPLVAPNVCPQVLAALKSLDSSLDGFAMALLGGRCDSTNGQIYSLPDDRSLVEACCTLEELKAHAAKRIEDAAMQLPVRAAWRSVVEETPIYAIDGSYKTR
jgi:hypothetical protein